MPASLRGVAAPLAAIVLFSGAARGTEPKAPYDVTSYPLVVQAPAMGAARVTSVEDYVSGAVRPVGFDVYAPAARRGGELFPVVVFVNGVGAPFRTWEIYRTWARYVTTVGLAGVVADSDGSPAHLRALVAKLVEKAPSLSLDTARLALWACSSNVPTALAAAMPPSPADAPAGLRAMAVYYGTGTVATLPHDLPVYWVLAGRDGAGLIEGQKALWRRAITENAPWTMVSAPELPHAFDALVETEESKRLVRETAAFLAEHLRPAEPAPAASAARRALTRVYSADSEGAVAAYREITSANPKDEAAWGALAATLLQAGRNAEAVDVLEKLAKGGEADARLLARLARAYLGAKRPADAAAMYEKALAKGLDPSPNVLGAALYNLACAYALSGRKDDALDRLEKAAAVRFGRRIDAEADEDFASLRGDPRFLEILKKLP